MVDTPCTKIFTPRLLINIIQQYKPKKNKKKNSHFMSNTAMIVTICKTMYCNLMFYTNF